MIINTAPPRMQPSPMPMSARSYSEHLHHVNGPELWQLQESSRLSQYEYSKQKNGSEPNQVIYRCHVLHVQCIYQAPVDIGLFRKMVKDKKQRSITLWSFPGVPVLGFVLSWSTKSGNLM